MESVELIEESVKEYISAHPEYELPPRSYHPMALIHTSPIRNYAIKKFGGVDMFWRIMLDAAKSSFKPKEESFEYTCFVSQFCIAGGMSANSIYAEHFGKLWKEYVMWNNN